MRIVIIGNGVAGMSAAVAARSRDAEASITLVSSESDHFFSRTALMYVFAGQMSSRDVEPFDRGHYDRMRFERVRDRVVRLDPSGKKLELQSGNSLEYDRLLIASGSVGRMVPWPGSDLDGVGNFVTWQNLEWLTEQAKRTKTAVVVGGGLIGIEAAEILLQAGIEVTFLVREEWFWPIALNPDEGTMIANHMKHHGCDLRLKTEVTEILGKDGAVTAVKTDTGETIDCQTVVVAVGVQPQTGWLAESGIDLDETGGIVVDEQLKTNLDDVWAAGDCTSVVWFNGVRRPEQLWYTSRDQGRVAGYNLAGDQQEYVRGTFYNSAKFFDLEYTTAGYVNFNFEGEQNWYQRESDREYSVRVTYLPDQSVVGFNMIGRRWDHRPLVEWVDQKRPLEWVLDHLHEALFDEEFMPKFRLQEG